MTAWVEVLVTMADGPSLPVRGVIRKTPDTPERINFAFAADREPVVVGIGGGDVRVWRDRSRMRIETPDGRPVFITDGDSAWQFGPTDEPPIRSHARRVRYLGTGNELLSNRPAHDWLGDDYTRPVGPIENVTFLGRDCWAVDLAPGPHKTGLLRIVVDRESGAVLEQRNDTAEVDVAYTEISVGEPVGHELFTWTGPSRDFDEERRARTELARADDANRLAWFHTNVADSLPVVRIPLPLRVESIHTLDEGTGAFQASVAAGFVNGMLARRPRSDQPWNLRWHGDVQRWSTDEFDWATVLYQGAFDVDTLTALQAALHPGETAITD